jgi:hypothetical protein
MLRRSRTPDLDGVNIRQSGGARRRLEPAPIEEDEMAVTGVHALIYTPEADELRRLLGDAFGWTHVDAGEGWLIFALPPAEVGVHPADRPSQELSLMCDDLAGTMSELGTRGVTFRGDPADRGWGIVVTMILPGGVEMLLYEPRHRTAHAS